MIDPNLKCFGCDKKPVTNIEQVAWCGNCLPAAVLTEVHTVWFDGKNKILTDFKASLKQTLETARQLYSGVQVFQVVQRGAMKAVVPDQVRLRVGAEL